MNRGAALMAHRRMSMRSLVDDERRFDTHEKSKMIYATANMQMPRDGVSTISRTDAIRKVISFDDWSEIGVCSALQDPALLI
jgi:hypothetical protein